MTQDKNDTAPQPTSNPPPPPLPGDVQHVIDYATKPGVPYHGPDPDPNAKTWGMVAHLSALVVLISIPPIIGPLVVWLMKRNEHPFIDDQGKEAVNFHLTATLAAIILSPTICIGIGLIVLPILAVAVLVLSVIAAIKANEGFAYRYPWTLRLIK